jgi:hypothetical protein
MVYKIVLTFIFITHFFSVGKNILAGRKAYKLGSVVLQSCGAGAAREHIILVEPEY